VIGSSLELVIAFFVIQMLLSQHLKFKVLILLCAFLLPQTTYAEESSMKIVALGDSTTAGTPYFQSSIQRPPSGGGNPEAQYMYWIQKKHPNWNFLNRGMPGERIDQIESRFERDVLREKPDVVIVLGGVNDLYQGYSPEWIETHLQNIYERAVQANIRVMMLTVLPYNQSDEGVKTRMKKVNDWIRSFSKEHSLGFADTYAVAEDPAHPGNLSGTPDGLHPDIRTCQKVGEAVARELEDWLKLSR